MIFCYLHLTNVYSIPYSPHISCLYREDRGKCVCLGLKNLFSSSSSVFKFTGYSLAVFGHFFEDNSLILKERHVGESGSRTHPDPHGIRVCEDLLAVYSLFSLSVLMHKGQ